MTALQHKQRRQAVNIVDHGFLGERYYVTLCRRNSV